MSQNLFANDTKTVFVLVRCSPQEWGNEIMTDLARQVFTEHPEVDYVEVQEHAGWYLGFNRRLEIVSTANDGCAITPAMREFWTGAKTRQQVWVQLETITS